MNRARTQSFWVVQGLGFTVPKEPTFVPPNPSPFDNGWQKETLGGLRMGERSRRLWADSDEEVGLVVWPWSVGVVSKYSIFYIQKNKNKRHVVDFGRFYICKLEGDHCCEAIVQFILNHQEWLGGLSAIWIRLWSSIGFAPQFESQQL